MKVDVYWNATERRFSIRHKGRVVAHATQVLVRDGAYVVRKTGNKVPQGIVRGTLEAWRGEPTYTAPVWLYPIWTKDDRAYRDHAIRNGLTLRYTADTFVYLDSFGDWEPARVSSGMTWLGTEKKKPQMRDFDPCEMVTAAFPSVLA